MQVLVTLFPIIVRYQFFLFFCFQSFDNEHLEKYGDGDNGYFEYDNTMSHFFPNLNACVEFSANDGNCNQCQEKFTEDNYSEPCYDIIYLHYNDAEEIKYLNYVIQFRINNKLWKNIP